VSGLLDSQCVVVWLDGADGSGKTTVASALASTLQPLRVAISREFGTELDKDVRGRTTSLELREMAVDIDREFDLWERQLAMLIMARRHNRIVIPALKAETDVVIVDRSPLSLTVYGNSLGDDFLTLLNATLGPLAHSDIRILLDTEAKVMWDRRAYTTDAVDALGPVHHRAVVGAYRAAVKAKAWGDWRTVDASQPFTAVVAEITAHITEFIRTIE
jgi:thymidylate kinase